MANRCGNNGNRQTFLFCSLEEKICPSYTVLYWQRSVWFFPVVMYGCESQTIKKAEHWGIDAFELWCRRGLLRVPWTARRSNQSFLKEINPEYSLEGLTPKLKYFGYPMRRSDSLEKTLMLGKHNEDWRHKEKEMTEDKMIGWYHPLNGHKFEQAPGVGDGHGSLVCCSPWGHKEQDKCELLNNNRNKNNKKVWEKIPTMIP